MSVEGVKTGNTQNLQLNPLYEGQKAVADKTVPDLLPTDTFQRAAQDTFGIFNGQAAPTAAQAPGAPGNGIEGTWIGQELDNIQVTFSDDSSKPVHTTYRDWGTANINGKDYRVIDVQMFYEQDEPWPKQLSITGHEWDNEGFSVFLDPETQKVAFVDTRAHYNDPVRYTREAITGADGKMHLYVAEYAHATSGHPDDFTWDERLNNNFTNPKAQTMSVMSGLNAQEFSLQDPFFMKHDPDGDGYLNSQKTGKNTDISIEKPNPALDTPWKVETDNQRGGLESLWKKIQWDAVTVGSFFKDRLGGIKDTVNSWINKGVDWIKSGAEKVGSFFSNAFDSVKNGLKSVGNTVSNWFKKLF